MIHDLKEGLTTIHQESGGLFDVRVWTLPQVLAQFVVDPEDPTLHVMAEGIHRTHAAACNRNPKKRPQCLCCETTFSRKVAPVRIVTLTAHIDDPSMASLSFICGECARSPDLEQRMLAVSRRSWPDMRTTDTTKIHDEGGHA